MNYNSTAYRTSLAQAHAIEAAGAERVGNLTILKSQAVNKAGKVVFYLKMWSGKATKPFAYYAFSSEAGRDNYALDAIKSDAAKTEQVNRWKAEAAAQKAEALATITVGTIFHYSWGYDQTNNDFYEVVERKAKSVVVRKIASESVEGSDGFMSCRVRPVPGAFIEGRQPMIKMINHHGGIAMDHGQATICSATDTFYCSWYH